MHYTKKTQEWLYFSYCTAIVIVSEYIEQKISIRKFTCWKVWTRR